MKTAEIISLHPGKQHNFEQAEQLLNHFTSVKHITSLAFSQQTMKKLRFLPQTLLSEFDKRSVRSEVACHTDIFPWYELIYKFKRLSRQTISYSFFKNRNRLFQEQILRKYSPPKIFIGFDTSSDLIFEKWKGKSILVLDLTIAIPQFKKKLAEDYKLSSTAIESLTKDDEIWYDIYKKELQLADYVLCGSDFVKQSCLYFGLKQEKLKVIPYGADLEKYKPLSRPEDRPEKPFKIAFVGNVSYRKGADVLLKAWEKISEKYESAELHFYGNLQIDTSEYSLKNVFFHGFITRDKLIENLSESHISILPTFFEGSSYAIYQSMALGLAVVTTQNSGSVIKHMDNGFIIEYGSEDQIYEALSQLIEDKVLRLHIANKAMNDIMSYTWENYGVKLQNFISNL
jgi:glycosyltransferase involved in cell wall biosynthesis